MDKSKILESSSLLEKYALGAASDLEIEVVEQAIDLFPEIKDELERIELALEKAALENKIGAPSGTKEAILNRIDAIQSETFSSETVASIPQSKGFGALAMAASFLLGCSLAGLIGWGIVDDRSQELSVLEQQTATLKEQCNKDKAFFAFINDEETVPVYLTGASDAEMYSAVSYWNDDEQKGLLKLVNLPPLDDDKTYQIWADVNGEMLNLGVLDYNIFRDEYSDIRYLPNAESLNITIEPAGGSKHPTVANLVVSGLI